MKRLINTSVGWMVVHLPERRHRAASLTLFDSEGIELASGKWWARASDIAWALTTFADVPEDEAQEWERWLVHEKKRAEK